MSQLIVIDRTPNDADEPADIQLPEGALALGSAAGLAWYKLPHGALAPSGSRAPTTDELAAARLELPAVMRLKQAARRKIEREVGDLHEVVADQARQIEALTALLCRLTADQLGGTAMDVATRDRYLARAESVVAALDSGELTLRGDAEGTDDMLAKVVARANAINEIITAEYLPRRRALLEE
ncbi:MULTISPECIES: hypothetical protein [unclassified Halomonas]|uniref:hypothetical protein n=1 Tax=unclassified Halomonas TaxID=2609666 RepID=UPI002888CF0D|nr:MULTISPECIES: hypothetical protein [unclassified Halomonas]MDT0499716.1 hypothetical protein [Halomonas sp. PAR7]MDT0510467.1 hypothetical protein [Halomonas sp. LES1]MDT0589824.1 hypothetical protein [Halomonas sp. PAR8]